MCELLGINFNRPVACSLSFRGFSHHGEHNPDGWGVARYDGKSCQIFKEPTTASHSTLASFLSSYALFISDIFIGHVRRAAGSPVALQNTHPFSRPFRTRDVVLAHNGWLDINLILSNLSFHPVGDTDSEYLFCALLTELSRGTIRFTAFSKILDLLQIFNQAGRMNLLFSEGDNLFVYRDINNYNHLYMTERVPPYGTIKLLDEDWEVDLKVLKDPEQSGVVIATRPLTDEVWDELPPGSLHVFSKGRQVYP